MNSVIHQTNRFEKRLTGSSRASFLPFTMLGWPDAETCLLLIKTMINAGADALELGIAFSDPIADGPTIQQAAHETIASGFRTKDALELIRQVREFDSQIPITVLAYYNTMLSYGLDRFCSDAANSGIDGITIVDLPCESADYFLECAGRHNIAPVFLVAPNSGEARIRDILQRAQGYVYMVSRLGITGSRADYDTQLSETLRLIKCLTNLPVVVGFGISTPEQAQAILNLGADGIVTGSAILELVRRTPKDELTSTLNHFVKAMANSGLREDVR